MYWKVGDTALAIRDIDVLLALDSKHIKGRVRRAKIYEEQASVSRYCYLEMNADK
jgi:hypothetical protein